MLAWYAEVALHLIAVIAILATFLALVVIIVHTAESLIAASQKIPRPTNPRRGFEVVQPTAHGHSDII